MLEYLENPRQAVRGRVRCRTKVLLPSGPAETTTEDVGALGCQIVLDERVAVGQALRLFLTGPMGVGRLDVDGRAAWVSAHRPWRVGVAFASEGLAAAAQWMERVRAVVPELFARSRTPYRVSLESTFYLGPPPKLPDLGADDLALLRQVGTGLCLCDLRCSNAEELRTLQNRFFALLEQGFLTFSPERASPPAAWADVLGE